MSESSSTREIIVPTIGINLDHTPEINEFEYRPYQGIT